MKRRAKESRPNYPPPGESDERMQSLDHLPERPRGEAKDMTQRPRERISALWRARRVSDPNASPASRWWLLALPVLLPMAVLFLALHAVLLLIDAACAPFGKRG